MVAKRPVASKKHVAAVFAAARAAQKDWAVLSLAERAAFCSKAVDAMLAMKDEIVPELALSMGRPVRYGAGELRGFEERARHMIAIAPQALARLTPAPKEGFERYITREALGGLQGSPTAPTVVRLQSQAGYAAGHLVTMSTRAAQARGTHAATDLLPLARRIEAGIEEPGDGGPKPDLVVLPGDGVAKVGLGGVEVTPLYGKLVFLETGLAHFGVVLSGSAGLGGTRHQLKAATVRTDVLASYRVVIPASQHRAVGKAPGLTAHVERFRLTLRQRRRPGRAGAPAVLPVCPESSRGVVVLHPPRLPVPPVGPLPRNVWVEEVGWVGY